MNIPEFSDEWHAGDWVPNPDGVTLRFVPYSSMKDVLAEVAPKVKTWTLHGTHFTDGKEAALLCGRLRVFYSGTKVVKQHDKYFILFWHAGDAI